MCTRLLHIKIGCYQIKSNAAMHPKLQQHITHLQYNVLSLQPVGTDVVTGSLIVHTIGGGARHCIMGYVKEKGGEVQSFQAGHQVILMYPGLFLSQKQAASSVTCV